MKKTMDYENSSLEDTFDSSSRDLIMENVVNLLNSETREMALLDLNKKRDSVSDLAPILWYSMVLAKGTMTVLVQELISIYPFLSPPTLTVEKSNRVCNALALLQCIASHSETRKFLLQSHVPFLLYPFLNTTNLTLPFQYLRLRSLGVIGALVKNDDPEIIGFLLSTEIIPLSLRIMEIGSSLSKTVATFIVQKILLDDAGLNYICHTYDRFLAVSTVLGVMVQNLLENSNSLEAQPARLLKHVIRCYLRLTDNFKAREALKQSLPEPLRHIGMNSIFKEDSVTIKWLKQLHYNLNIQN